ncbi:MAG: hypothetical protein IT318_08605 [Anaerolineales bacterium]|nr:hypothetical protein [Anaerolineales bacterium]
MGYTRARSLEQQMLDALLAATGLALDDVEYEVALDAVGYYAAQLEELPANFPTRVVEETEWSLGLGLDPQQHAAAVAAVKQVLQPPPPPAPEPDAFLEMAYEDRTVSDYGDWDNRFE